MLATLTEDSKKERTLAFDNDFILLFLHTNQKKNTHNRLLIHRFLATHCLFW